MMVMNQQYEPNKGKSHHYIILSHSSESINESRIHITP